LSTRLRHVASPSWGATAQAFRRLGGSRPTTLPMQQAPCYLRAAFGIIAYVALLYRVRISRESAASRWIKRCLSLAASERAYDADACRSAMRNQSFIASIGFGRRRPCYDRHTQMRKGRWPSCAPLACFRSGTATTSDIGSSAVVFHYQTCHSLFYSLSRRSWAENRPINIFVAELGEVGEPRRFDTKSQVKKRDPRWNRISSP